MRGLAQGVENRETVHRKAGFVGEEAGDRLLADGEKLGIHEARGVGELGGQHVDLLTTLHRRGVAEVLVGGLRGIGAEAKILSLQIGEQLHRLPQRRRILAEPPLEVLQLRKVRSELRLRRVERGLIFVEQREIPHVSGIRRGGRRGRRSIEAGREGQGEQQESRDTHGA